MKYVVLAATLLFSSAAFAEGNFHDTSYDAAEAANSASIHENGGNDYYEPVGEIDTPGANGYESSPWAAEVN